jgi:hypothetical protein
VILTLAAALALPSKHDEVREEEATGGKEQIPSRPEEGEWNVPKVKSNDDDDDDGPANVKKPSPQATVGWSPHLRASDVAPTFAARRKCATGYEEIEKLVLPRSTRSRTHATVHRIDSRLA